MVVTLNKSLPSFSSFHTLREILKRGWGVGERKGERKKKNVKRKERKKKERKRKGNEFIQLDRELLKTK